MRKRVKGDKAASAIPVVEIPTGEALSHYAKRYPEFDTGKILTILHLLKTSSDLQRALEIHFARYGLTRARFSLLMLLFRNQETGLTPSELATKLHVTRGNMTGLVDGLEKTGLLSKEDDPSDRRVVRMYLSSKGIKLLDKIMPDHLMRIKASLQHITEGERAALIAILAKVQDGLKCFAKK